MKDFFIMRGGSDYAKLYLRKTHELAPFEDIGPTE